MGAGSAVVLKVNRCEIQWKRQTTKLKLEYRWLSAVSVVECEDDLIRFDNCLVRTFHPLAYSGIHHPSIF